MEDDINQMLGKLTPAGRVAFKIFATISFVILLLIIIGILISGMPIAGKMIFSGVVLAFYCLIVVAVIDINF